MKVSAAARVDTGNVRKNNEDNLYFNGVTLDENNREERFASRCDFDGKSFACAVCDGMGGESCGEAASLAGARAFARWNTERGEDISDWKAYMRGYFEKANADVLALGGKDAAVSGSTAVTLLLRGSTAYFGNLGDSRLYIVRDGAIAQLSVDHTLAQMYVNAGQMTAEDARRSRAKHQLVRFLGARGGADNIPFVGKLSQLREGDRFILCSDGLTDMLTDEQICEAVKNSPDADTAAQVLLDAALESGGHDNCTIIVVQVDGVDREPQTPENRWPQIVMYAAAALAVLTLILFLLTHYGFWSLF